MKDGKLFDLLNKVKEHIGSIFGYNLIWKFLYKFFVQPTLGPIFREIKEKAEKVKAQIEKIKKLKKILEMIKKLIKAIVKVFKIVIKLLSNPYVDLAILCIFLIFAIVVWLSGIMEIFGGFRGTITVDVDKMKEMNVDSSDYTDLLNTDALLEAFYQDVADRSVYQTFNLRDMNQLDGLSQLLVDIGTSLDIFGAWESSDPIEERRYKAQEQLLANRKKVNGVDVYDKNFVLGFSGPLNFVAYDPRYIYTDANKNPLKYLKQAEVVGTNENSTKVNAYFRDYFKREGNFMLSEELLYELNNWLYKDSKGAVKIVYPEAFTKPIHFVNDYMRINDDTNSKKFGQEYVYVTQRVTLDDIRDTSSDFYNQYDAEGLIYSEPSSIIYDYAISDSNLRKLVIEEHAGTTSSSDSTSADSVNVGNVSDFAKYDLEIFYDEDNEEDKDKITEVVKLYWKLKDDTKYLHMGMHVDEENVCKYFTGPYITVDISDSGISFDEKYNLGLCDTSATAQANGIDSGKLKWGVVDVDINNNTLSFSTETYTEGDEKSSSSTTVYVDPTLNRYPRKHMQVAPLTDEGEIIASSRNLFNKVYIEVKSIKNSYRSSDEYWSDFANFIEEDTARSGDCLDAAKMKEDMAKKWDDRKCSVIRYYSSNDFVSWVKGKALELKAYFQTGDAKNAEMKISSKAMYGILLEYEEYLKRYGTYNVEWEYKYFSQTENDKLAALAEFSPSVLKMATSFSFGSFLGGGIGGALSAVSEFFETDKEIYQDTFSKMVEQDEDLRTVASEYVPVAIITGNEIGNKNNVDKNGWGWGYKYTTEKDGSGQRKVTAVYGEASMQFPYYYTFAESEMDTIIGGMINAEQTWLNGILPSDIRSVFSKIVKFIPETSYGEITYGMPNFQRYWSSGGKIERLPWYLDYVTESESDNVFSNAVKAGTQYKFVKDEDGSAIDFRNSDYIWNNNATVWRPAAARETETVMVKCNINIPGQCGRVTTTVGPDDYLPMEVKSVRDYGLGSVLSYIESRKVVFNTGVSMGEELNEEGVTEVVKNLNGILNTSGDKVIDNDDAAKGFIPKDILNMDVSALNAEGKASFLNIYRKQPASLEDLGSISQAFTSAQGTGATSASFNGCTYTLNGAKNATQNQYLVAHDGGANCIDELYAFVPHVTQGWFDKVMEWIKFWEPDPFLDSNQFWDPMYYYLTWFDYSQKTVGVGEDPFDRSAKITEDGNSFIHFIDTTMAEMLRNVKNNPSENGYHLNAILNVDNNWFSKTFKDSGADVTTKTMNEFFDQYSGNIEGLELIDKSRSEELYLIEEAATFIGEFIYTYKDTMKVIGNLSNEDAIIDDLFLIDRHYYISHYAFALPKWKFGLNTESFSGNDAGKKCEKRKKEWIDAHGKFNLLNPKTYFNDKTKIYYEDPQCISTGENKLHYLVNIKK